MSQYYKNKDNIYEFHPIGRCVEIYNHTNVLLAKLILQTRRRKALKWWNNLWFTDKMKYHKTLDTNVSIEHLTGREIEILYNHYGI